MNFKEACAILEYDGTQGLETLKKQYKIKALIWHPDKNKDPDAAEKFVEIKEAYDYLLEYNQFSDSSGGGTGSYYDMFLSFFSGSNDLLNQPVVSMIIQNIVSKCETRSLELLGNLDKKMLNIVYELIVKHRDIMHISGTFIEKIETLMKTKVAGDECIILNPFIDDLFNCNLFKLNEKGNVYYIPLWHHQLIYDCCGNDLYVNCLPLLDENIKIDSNNNVIIYLERDLKELFCLGVLHFSIGSRNFKIETSKIKLIRHQTIQIFGIGIPRINTRNVYDVSKQGDIIVYLDLVVSKN